MELLEAELFILWACVCLKLTLILLTVITPPFAFYLPPQLVQLFVLPVFPLVLSDRG